MCPTDILISWDYWELERKMAEGGGPIAELPTIPKQFATVDVSTRAACGGSKLGDWPAWVAPGRPRSALGTW